MLRSLWLLLNSHENGRKIRESSFALFAIEQSGLQTLVGSHTRGPVNKCYIYNDVTNATESKYNILILIP